MVCMDLAGLVGGPGGGLGSVCRSRFTFAEDPSTHRAIRQLRDGACPGRVGRPAGSDSLPAIERRDDGGGRGASDAHARDALVRPARGRCHRPVFPRLLVVDLPARIMCRAEGESGKRDLRDDAAHRSRLADFVLPERGVWRRESKWVAMGIAWHSSLFRQSTTRIPLAGRGDTGSFGADDSASFACCEACSTHHSLPIGSHCDDANALKHPKSPEKTMRF